MRAAGLVALLLLMSCGDDRPPVPSAAESDQLNEAEELLNEQVVADNDDR